MIIPKIIINCLRFAESEYSLQCTQLKALIRSIIDIKLFFLLGWTGMGSTITKATTGLLHRPRPMMSRDNRCTRGKTCPMSHCPPQIPHNLTLARTQAAVVGSRRLTSWTITRPILTSWGKRDVRIFCVGIYSAIFYWIVLLNVWIYECIILYCNWSFMAPSIATKFQYISFL
jgi:hypothetical protein